MARVKAVFYDGDTPIAFFSGSEEVFERNRNAEGFPWRVLTETPWEAIEHYRSAPTLSEFEAWSQSQAQQPA